MITERMTMKYVVYISLLILFNIQILHAGPSGHNETTDPRAAEVKSLVRFMTQSGATADETARMARMMDERKISVETVQSVRRTLMNAQKGGLPLDPLIHKAFEGMAKNVTETALSGALEKTRLRYAFGFRKTRELNFPVPDTERIASTVADCMSASVSEKHMNQIMDQIVDQIKTRTNVNEKNRVRLADQSLDAGRTMARMGVPSEKVRDVVCLALKRDYSADDFNELQRQFVRRARIGSALQLAEDYAEAISRGARAYDLNEVGAKGYGRGRSGSEDSGSSSGSTGSGGSGYSGGSGTGGYGSGTSGSNGSGYGGGRRGGQGGRN